MAAVIPDHRSHETSLTNTLGAVDDLGAAMVTEDCEVG